MLFMRIYGDFTRSKDHGKLPGSLCVRIREDNHVFFYEDIIIFTIPNIESKIRFVK